MRYVVVNYRQFTTLVISLQWLLYISLGSVVIADILIATSICVLLYHRRSGFKSYVLSPFSLDKILSMEIRSDSLVTTLMLYSINTGEFHLVADWFLVRISLSLQVYSHRKETFYLSTRLIMFYTGFVQWPF